MFQYQYAAFNYEPYPIGLVKPILDESFYQELVASFPDIGLFRLNKSYGGKTALKYSLSEGNNPELYQKFITNTSVWREFHQWIKSSDFIKSTLEMLLEHHIDLGLLKPEKQQQVGWLKKLLSKKTKGQWPFQPV